MGLSRSSVGLPLSVVSLFAPPVYTRVVYTPVSFILIPLHLETRHGPLRAQQPRVGNAPGNHPIRPNPSPQPTRHCNFVQSYFDVSLTLAACESQIPPSTLDSLFTRCNSNPPPFVWLAIVNQGPRCCFFAVLQTRDSALFYSFSHCSPDRVATN